MCFQRETAERPASNASRKPSSVSPRGVLIAIPVTAMRSVLNKINLHYRECANGVILRDLPGAHCRVIVPQYLGCGYIEPLTGSNLAEKCRMMNANETDIGWPLI